MVNQVNAGLVQIHAGPSWLGPTFILGALLVLAAIAFVAISGIFRRFGRFFRGMFGKKTRGPPPPPEEKVKTKPVRMGALVGPVETEEIGAKDNNDKEHGHESQQAS